MRSLLSKGALVLLGAALACDKTAPAIVAPDSGATSALTVRSAASDLGIGDSTALTAVDANGNIIPNQSVTWSTSNPRIATVSATGVVVAVAAGVINVTAARQQAIASLWVKVNPPVVSNTASYPTGTDPVTGTAYPNTYINTAMPAAPASGGQVISVAAGGDLQGALDRAKPGDVVELAPGASFTGNYVLRNKQTSSTSWIVVRTALGTRLPAEGSRMSPATAASLQLAKILTPNSDPAIRTESGAHHYRFTGIEVSATPSATINYGLVTFGGTESALTDLPHDLVVDRSYVHGTGTLSLSRCVAFNSIANAVIDSYLSECHAEGQDAQAVAGWSGPGPFKIVNNYLEGSGENVMFGGSDPYIANVVPSDIEIRRNHFFKPTTWVGGRWLIKNLFELKNAQRLLVEGNVFENCWPHGQEGTAIALKSTNQSGRATWSVTQDLMFRKNIIRNVGSPFSLAAAPDPNPVIHMRRVAIMDNVAENINVAPFTGSGRGFLLSGDLSNITLAHNTVMRPTAAFMYLAGSPTSKLVVRDNIADGGAYGILADGYVGSGAWSRQAPDGTLKGNVLVMGPDSSYPTGNFFASSVDGIGFTSWTSGDYSLLSTSPYKGKATDGRDPGADVAAVRAAVNGVVQR